MGVPSSQTLTDDGHGSDEQEEQRPDSSQKLNSKSKFESPPDDVDSHYSGGTPVKFLPLHHVYSATSPFNGSSNVVSKKVRARKLALVENDSLDHDQTVVEQAEGEEETHDANGSGYRSGSGSDSMQGIKVYSRRREKNVLFDSFEKQLERDEEQSAQGLEGAKSFSVDVNQGFVDDGDEAGHSGKKRRVGRSELVKLGVNSNDFCSVNGPRFREQRFPYNVAKNKSRNGKRKKGASSADHSNRKDLVVKKWFQLAFDGADPMAFVGLKCKVFWPLDNAWYKASVTSYDSESKRHSLKYEDGDEEELILADEQIKFHISKDEMEKLNLKGNTCMNDDPDYSQMVALAATLDDSREPEPGDIIWAKLTGHAMWPAFIMDESTVSDREGLNKNSGGKSVPVQFFGTHDFARLGNAPSSSDDNML